MTALTLPEFFCEFHENVAGGRPSRKDLALPMSVAAIRLNLNRPAARRGKPEEISRNYRQDGPKPCVQ